jgi:hypothetical protein
MGRMSNVEKAKMSAAARQQANRVLLKEIEIRKSIPDDMTLQDILEKISNLKNEIRNLSETCYAWENASFDSKIVGNSEFSHQHNKIRISTLENQLSENRN